MKETFVLRPVLRSRAQCFQRRRILFCDYHAACKDFVDRVPFDDVKRADTLSFAASGGRPRGCWETQEEPLEGYRASPMRRTISGDSARLDALTRAGNLYLSLKDAIALTIENNLDVEYQRITPFLAEADLMRARAGGVARGVPSNVREGPTGLGSSGTDISGTTGIKVSPTPAGHRQPVPPSRPQ